MAIEPIEIVPYDPNWPIRFEAERTLLAALFTGTHVSVEHIGSTAVRGLGAKPIIDLMLGLDVLDAVEERIGPLESIGYDYVPELEAQLPERRYFQKFESGRMTHHLHCVRHSSEFFRNHLRFRDYLRSHPEAARSYFELKQRLALRYRTDRAGYTAAKTDFISSVLERSAS